ncbi:hypothetical protein QCA50_008621 [Cerrena zonata]|uniref:tRNA (cytosine(38)-C(5))-methyltransferase n=1 Tax=Cerrena zonata TaxID=2478898 RepID=A0AAW0G4K3_9APHY
MTIRAIEFYCGIGGLHKAFETSNVSGSVVCAYDWDQSSCHVYETNYGTEIVKQIDITKLTASGLGSLDAQLWLLSPSCQPYTVLNPEAKGAADPRAKSFIHLMEVVLPELVKMKQHPSHLLVENVAGFETSTTRTNILQILQGLGYNTFEILLTPLQFGIPNSRLRYYLLAKSDDQLFADVHDTSNIVWRHIPGQGVEWEDPRSRSQGCDLGIRQVREYLDVDTEELGPYTIPDRVLEKWGRLFDIILPSSRRSCCFTRGYTKMAERAGSVLQLNELLDTTKTFDQFLAKQQAGDPNAVRLLDELKLRYFTPNELLRLFCFEPPISEGPQTFKWPDSVSTKTRYKLMGNSVNVHVVRELIRYLFKE